VKCRIKFSKTITKTIVKLLPNAILHGAFTSEMKLYQYDKVYCRNKKNIIRRKQCESEISGETLI